MASDNVRRAIKIIEKNSAVFESLLEFERTGKLPDYEEVVEKLKK